MPVSRCASSMQEPAAPDLMVFDEGASDMQTSTWPTHLSSDAHQKFQKCQANRGVSRQPFGDMTNCEGLCHQATVEEQIQ